MTEMDRIQEKRELKIPKQWNSSGLFTSQRIGSFIASLLFNRRVPPAFSRSQFYSNEIISDSGS